MRVCCAPSLRARRTLPRSPQQLPTHLRVSDGQVLAPAFETSPVFLDNTVAPLSTRPAQRTNADRHAGLFFSPLVAGRATMRFRRAARVLLVGAPGVGKGTQTQRLLRRYPQLQAISAGDLLRSNVKSRTPLGRSPHLFSAASGGVACADTARKTPCLFHEFEALTCTSRYSSREHHQGRRSCRR